MSWLYEIERRRMQQGPTLGLRVRRRRLHWGRARPSSGVLRLEMRGRFGQNPRPWDGEPGSLIMNKLGSPCR